MAGGGSRSAVMCQTSGGSADGGEMTGFHTGTTALAGTETGHRRCAPSPVVVRRPHPRCDRPGLTTHRDREGLQCELLRRGLDRCLWRGHAVCAKSTYRRHRRASPAISTSGVHQHQADRFYCVAGRIVVAISDPWTRLRVEPDAGRARGGEMTGRHRGDNPASYSSRVRRRLKFSTLLNL